MHPKKKGKSFVTLRIESPNSRPSISTSYRRQKAILKRNRIQSTQAVKIM